VIKLKTVVYGITYFIGFIGFLSVSGHVSPTYSAIFLIMFFAGLFTDWKGKKPLPRWALNLLSLTAVASLFFRISAENVVLPVVETLLLLLGIKLLEDKEFRDFMQIYTISVFLLTGSALLSIDISFMLFFTVMFFSVVVAVVLLTYYSQDRELAVERDTFRKIVLSAVLIPSLALPLTGFFFILLPRTQQPLFNLIPAEKSTTGFSDSISIGDVSQIQESNETALRIKTDRKLNSEAYIRAVVLNFFDGKTWKRIRPAGREEKAVNLKGRIKYTVILEPTGSRYLPALELPLGLDGVRHRKEKDFVFSAAERIYRRVKYTAISYSGGKPFVKPVNLPFYTQLPYGIDERIVKLAESLKGKTVRETVNKVVSYLKENYSYSLQDLPVSEDPLSQFLFEVKKGNCEYFASAGAVLLRLNGIPTRLVAGYKGVVYNRIGDYYIVPQKYAHTWIEVNIDGYWERYDPTAGSPSQILSKGEKSLAERLRLIMDALEYAYINSIINFDFQKQVKVVRSTVSFLSGFRSLFEYLKFAFPYIAIGLAVSIGVVLALRELTESRSRKVLRKFLKKLEKKGYKKKENQGLEEFVLSIPDGQVREKALRFVRIFESYYYRDREIDRATYRILLGIVNDI